MWAQFSMLADWQTNRHDEALSDFHNFTNAPERLQFAQTHRLHVPSSLSSTFKTVPIKQTAAAVTVTLWTLDSRLWHSIRCTDASNVSIHSVHLDLQAIWQLNAVPLSHLPSHSLIMQQDKYSVASRRDDSLSEIYRPKPQNHFLQYKELVRWQLVVV